MDSLLKDSIMKDSILKVDFANSGFEFEGDSLSPERLKAFEVRATQKLKDLYDYFRMMLDTSIEKSFKLQAKQMMLALFESPESSIVVALDEGDKPQKMTVSDFANKLTSASPINLKFEIEKIRTNTEIEKGTIYKGELIYTQTIYRMEGSNPVIIQHGATKVKYVIKRIKKQFGNTQKEVWEVLLGDILIP